MVEALARSMDLLEAIIVDGGAASTMTIAASLGMPHSTAHRVIRTLLATGFLVEVSRGRYIAGARLRGIVRQVSDWEGISAISRRILANVATKYRCVAHLGVLQDGMVTYLVKQDAVVHSVFTREGSQLEAYCSALGKVLLAHLAPDEREIYLGSGPFVRLTAATITDPALLRKELQKIATLGIAWDREEVATGLICCAAPVAGMDGAVCAAVSLSFDMKTYLELGSTAIAKTAARTARQVTRAVATLPTDAILIGTKTM